MEILYKYRSWSLSSHKKVLQENQLYFSPPKDLNDPFDYRIHSDYSLLNTDEKITAFVSKNYINLSAAQKQKFGPFNLFLAKNLHLFKTNPEWVQSYFEKAEATRGDDHFGVLCLSFVWDSVLMWTHYADNHRGFCVGFDKQKFIDLGKYGCGPMHYGEFPSITPLEDPVKESVLKSHSKALDWEYEKEYRISTAEYPDKLSSTSRILTISDDFYKEIVLGLNITEEDKREITEIAKQKSIPLYQIKKSPLSFKLSKEQV